MYQQQPSFLPTATHVAVELPERQPIRLSFHIAWSGLQIQGFQLGSNLHFSIPSVCEDVIILQTTGVTRVEGQVVQRFKQDLSTPGTMYLVPHGVSSEWITTVSMENFHLWLEPWLLPTIASETVDIEPARIELIPRIGTEDSLIYQLGLTLLTEARTQDTPHRLYVDSLIQTLALHLLRHHVAFPHATPQPIGGLAQPALRQVLDYIDAHLADDLTLAELAGLTNYSPYHFTRLFKQSTGCTLHTYVIERRVEAARRLLCQGTLSVAEVATLAGFHDQGHLSRHFKRLLGSTPTGVLKDRKIIREDRKNLRAKRCGDELE